jgi:transcriptional regulator with XRE-family HTH domain
MISSSVEIGKRLAWAREAAGLSGRRLADLAGLSSPYLLKLERGDYVSPGVDRVGHVAGVLGLDLNWVLSGVGEPPAVETIKAAVAQAKPTSKKARLCPHCGLDTLLPSRAA